MRAGKAARWHVGLGLSKIDNHKPLSREEFLIYVIPDLRAEDWRMLKYKSLPELLYFKTRYRQAPAYSSGRPQGDKQTFTSPFF